MHIRYFSWKDSWLKKTSLPSRPKGVSVVEMLVVRGGAGDGSVGIWVIWWWC